MYNTMFNRIKTSQSEYCIDLLKYLEGYCEPWTPPTREKTPPAYEWKTPASHTLHIRAFMTKMLHFNNIPTPNRQGMDSNAPFASGFHKQRKKFLHNFGENINNQCAKKAHNGPFASFFLKFSREDHDSPLLRENKKSHVLCFI